MKCINSGFDYVCWSVVFSSTSTHVHVAIDYSWFMTAGDGSCFLASGGAAHWISVVAAAMFIGLGRKFRAMQSQLL